MTTSNHGNYGNYGNRGNRAGRFSLATLFAATTQRENNDSTVEWKIERIPDSNSDVQNRPAILRRPIDVDINVDVDAGESYPYLRAA